jgi:FixJ family two-component response regulator
VNKTRLDIPNADSLNGFEDLNTKGSPLSASACDSIWLLDDDASMLKALGRLMSSAGLIAEKFTDPVAFLARLKHDRCRVAVLDVWMPQMNGLEVQACLRQDSPETRIIFITGRDDPSVRQTALDAGALAFLTKPFEDETLVQLVRTAVAP